MISNAPNMKTDQENAMIHGREGRLLTALKAYNSQLSRAELKEKYGKMAMSPFIFYRGTAHLFWMDFQWDWRLTTFGSYRTRTWLNADCHTDNFGAFSEDGVGIVYGLNDFDESIVADYQYDLWRLAVSLILVADQNGGFSRKDKDVLLDALASGYLKSLLKFAGNKKAEKAVHTSKNTRGELKKFLLKTEKKESRGKMLQKWTTTNRKGQEVFDQKNPKLKRLRVVDKEKIARGILRYIKTTQSDIEFGENYFNVLDVARRASAGTGSLGVDRYYVLIEGGSGKSHDNVILDVKEEPRPSAYPYASMEQKQLYRKYFPTEGIRFVTAYRALSFHPDDHLGYFNMDNKSFGVRERNPWKNALPTDKLKDVKRFSEMADQWGHILAAEHARGSKITNYKLAKEVKKLMKKKKLKVKDFQRVVRDVAHGYAEVVYNDYGYFMKHLAPDLDPVPKEK